VILCIYRMGRTKPTLSADYIVGLTDGEGCFHVNLVPLPAYTAGWRVQLHFHLKLQAKDEALLWELKRALGCGNVYLQKETRANHAQCYRYTISAMRDIERVLIPFFVQHPLRTVTKQKNFQLFCTIARIVCRKEHLTLKGIEKIKRLKVQMNQRTVGLA